MVPDFLLGRGGTRPAPRVPTGPRFSFSEGAFYRAVPKVVLLSSTNH